MLPEEVGLGRRTGPLPSKGGHYVDPGYLPLRWPGSVCQVPVEETRSGPVAPVVNAGPLAYAGSARRRLRFPPFPVEVARRSEPTSLRPLGELRAMFAGAGFCGVPLSFKTLKHGSGAWSHPRRRGDDVRIKLVGVLEPHSSARVHDDSGYRARERDCICSPRKTCEGSLKIKHSYRRRTIHIVANTEFSRTVPAPGPKRAILAQGQRMRASC